MNRNNNTNRISNLYFGGSIIERTKIEIVTYILRGNNDQKFYIDDYAPESYYDIGEQVCLPV